MINSEADRQASKDRQVGGKQARAKATERSRVGPAQGRGPCSEG